MDPQTQAQNAKPENPPDVPENGSSKKKLVALAIGCLLLLVIIIGGIYVLFSNSGTNQIGIPGMQTEEKASDPLATAQNPSAPVDPNAQATYENEEYGWSVTHPATVSTSTGAIAPPPPSSSITILNTVDLRSQTSDGSQAGQGWVTFIVQTLQKDPGISLEDLVTSVSEEEINTFSLTGFTTQTITIDNIQGIESLMQGNTEVLDWRDIYVPKPNRDDQVIRIRISYVGDTYGQIAEEMLKTFRLN